MKWNKSLLVVFIMTAIPVLFWALGDFPQRSALKETISLLTLVAFSNMLGQFFISRLSKKTLNLPAMPRVIKVHKIIGYVFVSVLLVHPFLIILPRYFEAGVEPLDAFTTLITTFESTGIILGMVAWGLMLIIGITSLFRNKLRLEYTQWRTLHSILSILFIAVASWHAIDLGRHTNLPISIFIAVFAAIGIGLLTKTYLFNQRKSRS